MLGAGSIIIQPATQRVCILEDIAGYAGQYFLPRGRKDVGESLEETALREAHEEVRLDLCLVSLLIVRSPGIAQSSCPLCIPCGSLVRQAWRRPPWKITSRPKRSTSLSHPSSIVTGAGPNRRP